MRKQPLTLKKKELTNIKEIIEKNRTVSIPTLAKTMEVCGKSIKGNEF